MSLSMVECSNCGKPFQYDLENHNDNQSPICPDCAQKAKSHSEKESKENAKNKTE